MSTTVNVQSLLGLKSPPVAIGFFEEAPDGVPAWNEGPVPAGCVFWRKAQEGKTFYTVPSDHYNCAIGAHTHKIGLPSERSQELTETLGFLVENSYLAMEEVPGIPILPKSSPFIAYGPESQTLFEPDLMVVAAQPAQAMLVYETALRAGAGSALINALGRPGCAILPLTYNSGAASISLGCKGNRTYTGLPDSEMYVCISGAKWDSLAVELAKVVAANEAVERYHKGRVEELILM